MFMFMLIHVQLSKDFFSFFSKNKCWINKEKFTRAGFEPETSGLTCRHSTNRAN